MDRFDRMAIYTVKAGTWVEMRDELLRLVLDDAEHNGLSLRQLSPRVDVPRSTLGAWRASLERREAAR